MSHVILHSDESSIEEDLGYYFSGMRDLHGQVRPQESIQSMTPIADRLSLDGGDGRVVNFFFPVNPYSVERVYIGISVSLFSNNWGASFLLELLKLVKPGGDIVLPVYPEGQAGEKVYWSRSFLENIFLSRSGWNLRNNINAENDGVMSMRVGRQLPKPIPSTIEWFYKERGNLMLGQCLKNCTGAISGVSIQEPFLHLCRLVWGEYTKSAVTERIITDEIKHTQAISFVHIGTDYGLLVNDLMLTPKARLSEGVTCQIGTHSPSILNNVAHYFAPFTRGKHNVICIAGADLQEVRRAHVVCISEVLSHTDADQHARLIEQAWSRVEPGGLLVVFEDFTGSSSPTSPDELDALLSSIGEVIYYSSTVATRIRNDVEISHYSLQLEEQLRQEKQTRQRVFRVVRK